MSDMIERVARAIAQANSNDDVEGYDILARAAIAEMRDATEDMVDNGYEAFPQYGASEEDMVPVWQAMIDAALAGGRP